MDSSTGCTLVHGRVARRQGSVHCCIHDPRKEESLMSSYRFRLARFDISPALSLEPEAYKSQPGDHSRDWCRGGTCAASSWFRLKRYTTAPRRTARRGWSACFVSAWSRRIGGGGTCHRVWGWTAKVSRGVSRLESWCKASRELTGAERVASGAPMLWGNAESELVASGRVGTLADAVSRVMNLPSRNLLFCCLPAVSYCGVSVHSALCNPCSHG